MANPQKENGYTPIANEIMEQVSCRNFNGAQLRLILAIWRLTYGFQRKSHAISVSLLAEKTGLNKKTVKEQIKKLLDWKVLKVVKEATYVEAREIAFNKDYDEWLIPADGGVGVNRPPGGQLTPRGSTGPLGWGSTGPPYKENIKENNTTTTDKGESVIERPSPFSFYEQNFGVITPFMSEELSLWLDDGSFDEPEEVVLLAMEEALKNNVRRWSYVNNILRDWRDKRLRTVRDVQAYKLEWQRRKEQRLGPALQKQQDEPVYRRA